MPSLTKAQGTPCVLTQQKQCYYCTLRHLVRDADGILLLHDLPSKNTEHALLLIVPVTDCFLGNLQYGSLPVLA